VIAGLPLRATLGAVSSGLALLVAFPRWDLGWLAWVALVPLLLAIRSVDPGQAFRLGCLAGLVAYGGLMEWIRIFGIPAWVLLTVGMAGFLGMFAAGASWLARRYHRHPDGAVWLWVVPLTWLAVEVVRSVGPLGFPWGLLGLTQYHTPAVLRLASLVGVLGVGALIALVNAAVAGALVEITRGRTDRGAVGAILLAVVLVALGTLVPAGAPTGMRMVAAVQPNIPPRVKGDPAERLAILDDLLRQTDEARRRGAELIVYPETAVPFDLEADTARRVEIGRRAGGAIVVAGAPLSGLQNGALVLGADGSTLGRYAKRRLVPFGEAGVRPGGDATPIATPIGTVGLAICYESSFTDLIAPIARAGADVLAVLTNDGWFGTSAGPAQHAAHAVLRAAEIGRSVVRAANTGTSMLILPDGTVLASQPLATKGVLVAAVPVGGPPTPYVRGGWLIAPMGLLAWVGLAGAIAWPTLRRSAPAVWRLAAVVVLPGAIFAVERLTRGEAGLPAWPTSVAVLALCAALTPGRLFARPGLVRSAGASLAMTATLVLAMRAAYAQYGFYLRLGPPPEAGMSWLLSTLLAGMAVEIWLRGSVFAAAEQLGGWPLAAGLSVVLGIALHLGASQELLFWHLFTGAGFAALRRWTGDAVGLGPARGLGDAAIYAVAGMR
jgi:apolipoprotein N-acyltransferase